MVADAVADLVCGVVDPRVNFTEATGRQSDETMHARGGNPITNTGNAESRLRERAEAFKDMHRPGSRLLLPNAWDAWSARVFEEAGFSAIGTTSAGVAYSRGFPDGQRVGRGEMMHEVSRIASAVGVPVTADVEAGYGPGPEDVAETVRAAIRAGAAGINLEDGTGDPDEPLFGADAHAGRVAAAREEADRAGIPLVINARTDTYLAGAAGPGSRFGDTVRRAAAYLKAGADCAFVPGVVDPETVWALAREIPSPLNVMAGPGAPPAPELFELGVARVSIGPGATLAAMGLVREVARELREAGTYATIGRYPYGFAKAEALMAGAADASKGERHVP
jgi:2-methylisocitrate lyase-like PEP mutase family enzyme